jgi:hypothetical protein
MEKTRRINQINQLSTILGLGAFTGSIPLAAISGFFKFENIFLIAVLFMAGPGAIATALLLDGNMKERILIAFLSGLIATLIVMLSAGIGVKILMFLNINILKIFGGISVLLIGLIIMGIKIPENIPLGIIILGVIVGGIFK